jgi:cytochrome c-type biogenesis protein CcmH/NrfG
MQRIALAALCCFAAIAVGQNAGDLWAKYQDDLKVNPRSSITRFRIGEIYWQQGRYLEAGNAFREALNGNLEPK